MDRYDCWGGGMITIPIMLLVGMSPSVAIATNKLQGVAELSWQQCFIKKKEINLKEMRLSILMTFWDQFWVDGLFYRYEQNI